MRPILLAALPGLLACATAAAAQDAPGSFRLLGANDTVAAMVSTGVGGPQTARTLVTLLLSPEPGGSGADNFLVDMVVDCAANTIVYARVAAYLDDKPMGTETAATAAAAPGPGSVDEAIVAYACTGKTLVEDAAVAASLADARAYGFAQFGEE